MATSDSWIKVRGCLIRHPKVAAMTGHLVSDRDFRMWLQPDEGSGIDGGGVSKSGRIAVTVGLLVAVWSAAREHGAFDGDDLVLAHNTLDDLDVLAGAPGVGKAMRAVGWASGTEDKEGVRLPDFKTYNVPRSDSERAADYRLRKSANENVTKSSRKPSRENHDSPLSLSSVSPSVSGFPLLEGESERKPKPIVPMHSRAYTPQFTEAWQAYPKRGRVEKPDAFAAWSQAMVQVAAERGVTNQEAMAWLLAQIKEFAASPKGQGQYAPAMHRFLKKERWTDDREAWAEKGSSGGSGVGKAAARRQAREAGQYQEEFGHVRTIDGSENGDRATGTDPGAAPRPASLPSFD